AAAASAGVKRLVYASSVAAYGFHRDNPRPLTEEVPARGTDGHYYSAQKAQVERLLRRTLAGSATDAYVFRPCIVAGRHASLLTQAQWISACREPVIMDTAKARRELRWRPRHTAMQTLRETIAAARARA